MTGVLTEKSKVDDVRSKCHTLMILYDELCLQLIVIYMGYNRYIYYTKNLSHFPARCFREDGRRRCGVSDIATLFKLTTKSDKIAKKPKAKPAFGFNT